MQPFNVLPKCLLLWVCAEPAIAVNLNLLILTSAAACLQVILLMLSDIHDRSSSAGM